MQMTRNGSGPPTASIVDRFDNGPAFMQLGAGECVPNRRGPVGHAGITVKHVTQRTRKAEILRKSNTLCLDKSGNISCDVRDETEFGLAMRLLREHRFSFDWVGLSCMATMSNLNERIIPSPSTCLLLCYRADPKLNEVTCNCTRPLRLQLFKARSAFPLYARVS